MIDDPESILRCTNKVYLADLLRVNDIPAPRTHVLQKEDIENIARLEQELGYPIVLKVPDGAFSIGVYKVKNAKELRRKAKELFKQSSLILAQEYTYTEFDWRIGILNRKPIFACQYYMPKGHWQVAKHQQHGEPEYGKSRAIALEEVPPELLLHAVEAANLIGDGLYGVDVKMTEHGPLVIEVNDNPNIDAGIEDAQLGDELYRIVLQDFVRRFEQKHLLAQAAVWGVGH